MSSQNEQIRDASVPRQPELSFEQSLAQLHEIVADLEEGNLGLEESMQRFEKGVGLLRQCYRTLEQAEQRIEILTRLDADGTTKTEPFRPDSNSAPAPEGAEAVQNGSPTSGPDSPRHAQPTSPDPRTQLF